jgi:hypothetical protein
MYRPNARASWCVGAAVSATVVMSSVRQRVGSPPVWQADVTVQALDVTALKRGGPVTARVVIATANEDARAVRVEVLLPVGVGVLKVSDSCRASPSPVETLSARVSCALGDMPVRARREVAVTTSGGSAPDARLRFAAFAYSDTPDPRPANNFAERVLP